MFPFYLTIPFLRIFSCSRLVYCCSNIVHLLGLILLKLHQFYSSPWKLTFACIVSSELDRWLWEAVTVGLSAHGMCVRVTSQCESPNENILGRIAVRWNCVSWALCAVVQVEVPQIDRLLSQLEEMSCTCNHQLSYTSAAKCFAGLVNKRPPG